jgi:predicted aldo/keto reductase-like oxidoreductase
MIQYNYWDERNQAGVAGLKHAASKGVPVMIMEPLRGGKLANPPKAAAELFAQFSQSGANRSPAEWALRWVWNHTEPVTVLSGMNTEASLEENLRVASEAAPGALTEAELALIDQARQVILGSIRVPCTSCGYCMPCPQGVDIPACFSAYNDRNMEGRLQARVMYAIRAGDHNASKCTRCGACEPRCPQAIPIRAQLADAKKALEGFPYRPARFVVKKFMRMT